MNSRKYLVFAVLAAMLSLSSCSGVKNGGGGGGGNGNASLSVSVSDTPPANTTVVSFTVPIVGVSLTSSSGSQVSVLSTGTAANFELTRLQSDSDVIVTNASVAAGTYTAVNVTVGAASGTFINNSGAQVGNCPAASPFSVCGLPNGVATTITFTFPASAPLVLNKGAKQWLDLDFHYNNAIVTTGGIGIDMQQANVLTATTTVPTGVPSGDFAFVDDFTGRVTAVSSSSITLSSTVRGSLTATINGSTQVFDPQLQCTGGVGNLNCIGVGSIVSLQGVLTNTGAVVATSLDVIDASHSPADEVEGTLYPSNCNGGSNFGMILSDSSITTSGSPLASAGFGAGVCLTLGTSVTFPIDFGILTGQPGLPVSSSGFANANDLLAGQTIRAKVTGAASGTNGINATATAMILRFSRLTGTFGTLSGTGFTINGLPSYITAFAAAPETQTYTNATLFEGAANVSSLSGTVSIAALFYNPAGGPTTGPLQAAKVRQH